MLHLQIEHQLWSARQQIESMLSAAGREGASALQELEGRLRGISALDLLAWEHWQGLDSPDPTLQTRRVETLAPATCLPFDQRQG